MLIHLAFMSPVYMNMIKTGEKTIESRLYKTANRDHPAMRAGVGDIVLFKRTGGNVEAIATVDSAYQYYDIDNLHLLKDMFNHRVKASDDFWESKKDSKIATFLSLTNVQLVTIEKRHFPTSREGWIILTPPSLLVAEKALQNINYFNV